MHLFIDTNIILSFYHLTNDDLEELRKLAVLVNEKTVVLYVTDQVVAEFTRNRESKIAEALKKLKEQRLNLQFPQVCKDYTEYDHLRDLQKRYDTAHSALLAKLHSDAAEHKLKADQVITELFQAATMIKKSKLVVDRAHHRIDIGNPPGKNGSLGDAINWELLLEIVPNGAPLVFVSDDKDYISALDVWKFKDFLQQEWKKTKASDILFYKRLSSFFQDKFPNIKLASELEKDIGIKRLAITPNFATTHTLVAKLSKYGEFTSAQASAILSAVLANNQVWGIIKDSDVMAFVKSILSMHQDDADPEIVSEIKALLMPSESDVDNDDEMPF